MAMKRTPSTASAAQQQEERHVDADGRAADIKQSDRPTHAKILAAAHPLHNARPL